MRKAIIPKPISESVGGFGLSRPVLVALLSHLHAKLPGDYPRFRHYRVRQHEDSQYRYRVVVKDEALRHLFLLAVDDATSPEHLIVTDIVHSARE
jgi:hypothetical protein